MTVSKAVIKLLDVGANAVNLRAESTLIKYTLTPAIQAKFFEDLETASKFMKLILSTEGVVRATRVLPHLTEVFNAYQRYVSLQKVAAAIAHIREYTNAGKQVCVLSLFRDTTVHLQEAFKKSEQATIYPRTPIDRKKNALKRFKTGKAKILIAQHHCVDVSVDLTHIQNLIFVDLSFSAMTNVQAVLRCTNLRQQKEVDVKVLCLRDHVDAHINRIIVWKMRRYFADGILRI